MSLYSSISSSSLKEISPSDCSIVQALNPVDKNSPDLNVSVDRFSARNDSDTFSSIRATAFALPGEVYFYEANLISCGVMQIGWATKESFFQESDPSINGIGDDQYSIGFDASRGKIWHNGPKFIIGCPTWKSGDVVGCLIDGLNRNFIFYLNGQEFDYAKLITTDLLKFSPLPYYPAASFDRPRQNIRQQIYFNFGQEPFRFPPKSVQFKDFYCNRFNP